MTFSAPAFSTTPASKTMIRAARPAGGAVEPERVPAAGDCSCTSEVIEVLEAGLKTVVPGVLEHRRRRAAELPEPTVSVPVPRRVPPVNRSAPVVPSSSKTSSPLLPSSVIPAA